MRIMLTTREIIYQWNKTMAPKIIKITVINYFHGVFVFRGGLTDNLELLCVIFQVF